MISPGASSVPANSEPIITLWAPATVAIQIYNWTTRPQEAFRANASAGIIVLMVMVIGLNLVAVLIRERFRRK